MKKFDSKLSRNSKLDSILSEIEDLAIEVFDNHDLEEDERDAKSRELSAKFDELYELEQSYESDEFDLELPGFMPELAEFDFGLAESDSNFKILENESKILKEIVNKYNIFDFIMGALLELASGKLGHDIEGFTKQQIKEICVPAIQYIGDKSDVTALCKILFIAANGEGYQATSTEMQLLQDDINFTKPEDLFDGIYALGIFKDFVTIEFKLKLVIYLTMQECLNSDKEEDFLTVFYRKIEMVEDPKSGFLEEVKQKFMEMVEDIFEFVLNPIFDQVLKF